MLKREFDNAVRELKSIETDSNTAVIGRTIHALTELYQGCTALTQAYVDNGERLCELSMSVFRKEVHIIMAYSSLYETHKPVKAFFDDREKAQEFLDSINTGETKLYEINHDFHESDDTAHMITLIAE